MKVPEPRKLPSGSWFIQLRLGGKSIPVTAATKRECVQEAERLKAKHRRGRTPAVSASSATVEQVLDRYIARMAPVLSPSTIRGYKTISNYFEDIKSRRAAGVDWQQAINELSKDHAAKTVKNAWRLVGSALKDAGIEAPSVALPAVMPNERPWLDPDQILVFVEAVKGQACEIPALLALHSLRRSEILGLTWDKVNLKAGTIRVSGAVVYDADNKAVSKSTNKNAASVRTVPIMIPALSSALLAARQASGPVVSCNPNTIWAQVNRVCRAAKLPEVGCHGLRHSFASLAYHLGLSELQTQELGGWSDPATMRKIYTHLAAADRAKASNVVADFFKNANENANSEA